MKERLQLLMRSVFVVPAFLKTCRTLSLAVLLFGLAASSLSGQSDSGTLHVAIRDKASGEVVPAMICITSRADNTWRTPPDGRVLTPYVTNKDFIAGRLKTEEYIAGQQKKWFPGDVGPVLLMMGDSNDDRRPLWYDGRLAMPFWKEPAAYFVSKPFTITLPPGKWRLAVQRGLEYLPFFEEFTVTAGQTLKRDIRLARWVDMPREGWYSGDAHVHSWRVAPSHDVFIITWAQAMDVHMTCVLSYCSKNRNDGAIQKGYGKDFRYQRGDYVLDSGHEGPREDIPDQGHMTQLNIQKIFRDPSRYHLYDLAADVVHAQGGLVGYTHLAWSPEFFRRKDPSLNPGWDATINIIRGKIDFIDILEAAHLGVEDYYDFLNLGIKLTAMSSSDAPATTIGEERTYAYTGHNFSADTWYAAVKQGRTFVTNGPMLTLAVAGAMPGDEVRVRKNEKVRIRAQAWAPEAIGAPKVLEVVSHGRVIRSAESRGPQRGKLVAEFELQAGESQWLAARTTAFNGAVAHTSPVYVIVDGASFVDRAQLPQLIEKRLKVLEFVEKRLHDPAFTRKRYPPDEVSELMARIKDARANYLAMGRTQ
jgi:hypothetical protein